MHRRTTGYWLLLLLGLFALSGAGCPNMLQSKYQLPRQLPPNPTIEQVIEVVNRNNGQIQSFWTDQASLSGPNIPSLRTTVAYQRPRYFRMTASTGLTGSELDIGSNDQLFWFWVRRNDPPALYYCRHDQYATSAAKNMIPIAPDMLINALGTAIFEPGAQYQGPFPKGGDRLEIHTVQNGPEGPTTKVTVIDAAQGWILEQNIYNSQGILLAGAIAKQHRQDPLTGLWMPKVVEINCPASQFSIRLDLGNVQINRTPINANQWTMPTYQGTQLVDLGNTGLLPTGMKPMPQLPTPQTNCPPAMTQPGFTQPGSIQPGMTSSGIPSQGAPGMAPIGMAPIGTAGTVPTM